MRKIISLAVIAALLLIVVGCAQHIHKVGKGAQQGQYTEARQWYILFGLIPLNNVDTNAMAGGAADYEIKTENGPLDIILNIFTSYVTVTSRTVSVTK
ncbi:hypothetical protein JW935_02960 [candidate division KSB1 bacterium]|nr:hypothetical protein [candidate division KSB1 bacterium]